MLPDEPKFLEGFDLLIDFTKTEPEIIVNFYEILLLGFLTKYSDKNWKLKTRLQNWDFNFICSYNDGKTGFITTCFYLDDLPTIKDVEIEAFSVLLALESQGFIKLKEKTINGTNS